MKNSKSIIEAILFAAGRQVEVKELAMALEESSEKIIDEIEQLKNEYNENNKGFEIIKVNDS